VRITGRNAQGVHLVRLEDGEKVRAVARLAEVGDEEDSSNGDGPNGVAGDEE
jgi:DNA gyrase C-terminal domain, beta-propeller